MPEPITIDMTPPGLKTPAGCKRVAEAQTAWENSTAAFANAAALFMQTYGLEIVAAMGKNKDMAQEFAELRRLHLDRTRKQDAFLLAVAGR